MLHHVVIRPDDQLDVPNLAWSLANQAYRDVLPREAYRHHTLLQYAQHT